MDVKSIFGKFVRKSWKGLQGTTIGTNFFSRVFFKETSRVDWETEPEKWTCFIIRRHIEDNVWEIHLAGRRADQETGNGSHWPENGRRRPMREQQQPDGGPIFPPHYWVFRKRRRRWWSSRHILYRPLTERWWCSSSLCEIIKRNGVIWRRFWGSAIIINSHQGVASKCVTTTFEWVSPGSLSL